MSAELTGSQRRDADDTLGTEPAEGLDRGLRPRERYRPSQPNEFRTPVLPTPRPERPSTWPQTDRSREETPPWTCWNPGSLPRN